MPRRELLFAFFFLLPVLLCAKQSELDSLRRIVERKDAPKDTHYVKACFRLCFQLSRIDPQEALSYGHQALELSEQLGFKRGIAASKNNLGLVYEHIGQNNKAAELYAESLELKTMMGDRRGMASTLNNLGVLYKKTGQYDEALKYYREALSINRGLGNKEWEQANLHNIGVILKGKLHYDSALYYYREALKIAEETGNEQRMNSEYQSLSSALLEKKEFAEALVEGRKALHISRKNREPYGTYIAYNNLALIFTRTGRLDSGRQYYDSALALSVNRGMTEWELDSRHDMQELLDSIYQRTKSHADLLAAYENLRKFVRMRADIQKQETAQKLADLSIQYEVSKKDRELLDMQHKAELQQAEADKQRTMIIFAIAGLVLLSILSVALYRRFRLSRRLAVELKEQKDTIEEKNKSITDSIHYAQRIQQSMLTTARFFSGNTKDFLVFYRPRDIVSGDFYWARRSGDDLYVAVADCTGHGVPGALMSMIGISLLNEIIMERKISNPALALDVMREEIVRSLNPEGSEEEGKDGMDMVLCRFRPGGILEFAAANNPVYVYRKNNETLESYSPDKSPVGKHGGIADAFAKQTINLSEGDVVFLLTDGYADQFGGPKGKKFKYRQLEELLKTRGGYSLDEVQKILERTFLDWKGELEQVDDVCVLGIRML